eukprot:scaffold153_cov347-Pavlova_lutheri.AAC.4
MRATKAPSDPCRWGKAAKTPVDTCTDGRTTGNGSSKNPRWRSRNISTTSWFSSGSKEQVLYTRRPPTRTILDAWDRREHCSSANRGRSSSCRLHLRSARLASTPVPEQGASTNTLSKGSDGTGKDNRSDVTAFTTWSTPWIRAAWINARNFFADTSTAVTDPHPFNLRAASSVFPPGAAHASSTLSPGFGSMAATARAAASSCTAHPPSRIAPASRSFCSPLSTRTNSLGNQSEGVACAPNLSHASRSTCTSSIPPPPVSLCSSFRILRSTSVFATRTP